MNYKFGEYKLVTFAEGEELVGYLQEIEDSDRPYKVQGIWGTPGGVHMVISIGEEQK